MLTETSLTLRPLAGGESAAARALVLDAAGRTPYAEPALETLTRAIENPSAEARALAAVRGGELLGAVVYGIVAGTVGAGRVYLVVVTAGARLRGVASRLVDAAVAELERERARFVLAEVPDDPRLAPGRELLVRAGFLEESHVPDFYADGVALTFLRRPVAQ
jgi:ribosomal protein S18 acetylase RimI-like enzyme